MWFLYLILTAPRPADLPRITGAVEEPVEEADSEDDSIEVGDAADVASDCRELRQQQEEDGDDDGEGAEGVEVIDEGLLCRDDIAPAVSELPAMRKRGASERTGNFLPSYLPPLPFDILQ